MPNTFAFIAVFSWPLAVYLLFRFLPRIEALCWSILGGYLLLPTRAGIDLPLVPTIDKDVIPALTAALMLAMGMGAAAAERERAGTTETMGAGGGRWMTPLLPFLILMLVSPIITVLNNAEPISYGPVTLPGLEIYDALSIIGRLLFTILPFLLAMRYLASPESHVELLKVIVLALAVYSLAILFEVRMSPQLNVMFYGFFPHLFEQHVRAGGFRPVVFLQHGLWLAILLAMSVLAAIALWRQRLHEGARAGQWAFVALYLALVLFLANSLGAFLLVMLIAPLILLLGVRLQLLAAGAIAVIVLLYPVLRSTPVLPVERIVTMAERISEDRAQSLQFRLGNEDALSERAAEKPIAGWGIWGRNEIYDPETGRSLTIADGAWIIVIGMYGWLGFIGQFGLLTLPILLLAFGKNRSSVTPATAGLALIMAVNLLDLLPNATLTPVTWLVGGALAGFCVYRAPAKVAEDGAPQPLRPKRSWGMLTDGPAGRPVEGSAGAKAVGGGTVAPKGQGPAWHQPVPRMRREEI